MAQVTTLHGFEQTMAKLQFQRLLLLMVQHGVPREAAAQLCLELAEMARGMDTVPPLKPMADLAARHYEDMASMMLGGSLLPRDPTR